MNVHTLDHIRIVLVNPAHPGNIGASARAMKNMGLSSLYLVDPKQFPHPQARAMACKATDIISNSIQTNTLHEALADCELVIGTSARDRRLPWPVCTPQEAAQKLVACQGKAALIFGREDAGLYNEELQQCHYHVNIPTLADYASLNLAAAVQILCYEIRMCVLRDTSTASQTDDADIEYPSAAEMEYFYDHLSVVLRKVDFYVTTTPRNILSRMRRLFTRARVDARELAILRGILTQVEQHLKEAS